MISNISKQFSNLQQDKLVICKKELMHIQQVLSFYIANSDNPYYKYFEPLKKVLKNEISHIKIIHKCIKDNYNHINIRHKICAFEFLVNIARIEKEISQLLYRINLLSNKLSQLIEEHFDQYIPSASLERRYSNKAITYFLDFYINSFKQDKNKKILNVWGTHNKYKAIDINNELKIIENTFWYYELSRLIPALIHEVGHFIFQGNEVLNDFNEYIEKNVPELSSFDNIGEEILSDIFSLEQCGESYIYTLFYTQVFTNFDLIYYDESIKHCYIPKPSSDSKDDHRKSFIIILRLKVLISFYYETVDKNNIKPHIEEIEDFINLLYSTDTSSTLSLNNIYLNDYPNYTKLYSDICSELESFTEHIVKTLTIVYKEIQSTTTVPYNTIFNEIWTKHQTSSENWQHPNIFREKILKNIFSGQHNIIHTPDRFQAYELTLYKLRTDITNKDDNDIVNDYTDEIFYKRTNTNISRHPSYKTFGIFNIYSNLEKNSEIPRTSIENFLTNTNHEQTLAYYTQKIPLSFLEKIGDDTIHDNNFFGLIMKLQLKQESIKNIRLGYQHIKDTLKEHHYSKYKIFKSLGPGDFVIIAENISIDNIYKLKEVFSNNDTFFRRTFSTIFLSKDIPKDFTFTNEFKLKSKIRLKKDPTNTLIDIKTFIEDSDHTSGVTDLEIEWNIDEPLFKILDKKKQFASKQIASDIQTFISKKWNL